jgi:glycosyltransferase involved in cell wall biosynthesis
MLEHVCLNDRAGNGDARHPLVSIRMTSYNHAEFIEQALTSVLDDPYPNKEIVIVDDASTDNSPGLIRDWIKRNGGRIPVKYFARETNQGIARTINQALSQCSGEYIISLASDDYLLPGGILQRVQYLRANPDKMAVFADCIIVDGKGKLIAGSGLTGFHHAKIRYFGTNSGIRREFILNWSVPGPVLMIRRGVLDLVGGYDEQRILEDWDFYLRMAAADLIGFFNGKVSAYRVHGNNVCMKPERKIVQLEDAQKILLQNMQLFRMPDKVYMIMKLVKTTRKIYKLKLRRLCGHDH